MTSLTIYVCDSCIKRITDFRKDLFTISLENNSVHVCSECFERIKNGIVPKEVKVAKLDIEVKLKEDTIVEEK